MKTKSAEAWEKRWRLANESLSVEERAELDRLRQQTLNFLERSEEYQKSILREFTDRNLDEEKDLQEWAAAINAGFSSDEYWNLTSRELYAVLEQKVHASKRMILPVKLDVQSSAPLKASSSNQTPKELIAELKVTPGYARKIFEHFAHVPKNAVKEWQYGRVKKWDKKIRAEATRWIAGERV